MGAIGSLIPFAMRNLVASIHGQWPDTHADTSSEAAVLCRGLAGLRPARQSHGHGAPHSLSSEPPPCARLPGRGLQMPAGLMSRGPGPRLHSRWPALCTARIAAPGSHCGNGRSGAPRRRSRPGLPSRPGLAGTRPGQKAEFRQSQAAQARLPVQACALQLPEAGSGCFIEPIDASSVPVQTFSPPCVLPEGSTPPGRAVSPRVSLGRLPRRDICAKWR